MQLLRSLPAVACATGLALCAFAAPAPELTRALPADTAVVLHLRDVPKLRANWEHTPFARTWSEPEVQKFFAPLVARFETEEVGQMFAELRRNMGMDLKDILDLLPGDAAIGILKLDSFFEDGDEAAPPYFVLAHIGDNQAKVEELQRKGLEANNESETTEEFQGETLHLVSSKDAETGELKPSEAWAIVDGVFIECAPKEVLQRVIAQLKSGGDSLGGVEEFAATYRRQPDANLVLFVNAESVMPAALQVLDAAGDAARTPIGVKTGDLLRHLGLDSLRSISLSAAVTREATTSEMRLSWRERRGLWSWLAFGNPPIELPTQIPEAWVGAGASSFSIPDAYRATMDLLRAALPHIEGAARMQIQTVNSRLKIDLERDLIGSLGGDLFSGETLNLDPEGKPVLARPTNRLIGVGLRDAATFGRTLETLKQLSPGLEQFLKTREYLGETICTFAMPAPRPGAPISPQVIPTVSYAVTRSHFLLSIGDDRMLENVLQTAAGNGRSFWKKPEVAEAVAELPPGYSAVSGYDTGRVVNMLFGVFANMQQMAPTAAPAAEGESANGAEAEKDKAFVNPAALPSADVVSRHWKFSATGTYLDANGIRIFSQLKHTE